ncbi:MAG: protein tyrosine phosphatase [Gemmatimonadales bacterium]
MVAGVLTAMRGAPERMLHGLRRRAARNALRRCRSVRDILVLCHGNLCRSPFAAQLLARTLTPFGIRVRSAGFLGAGPPSPREAVAAARRRMVDLTTHRATTITVDTARSADVIVVMNAAQRRAICRIYGRRRNEVLLLGDFDPAPIESREIADPVGQSEEIFGDVYARIARCAEELALALADRPRQS